MAVARSRSSDLTNNRFLDKGFGKKVVLVVQLVRMLTQIARCMDLSPT